MADRQVLLPRPSSKFISEESQHVKIEKEGIEDLSKKLLECMQNNSYSTAKWRNHPLNPKVADEKAVEWIFVCDMLNFSFWPDDGAKKFNVTYKDIEYTGYWSLCAGINAAVEKGIPLTDPAYYSKISVDVLEELFRANNGAVMPLLGERAEVLNDGGKTVIEKFGGSFVNCVKKADGSAVKLVQLVVENFPSFRDEATFRGKKVSLYKRAQILAADLWACFEGEGLGAFHDIDELTIFADYRIPQALVYFGVLDYSDELMAKLKRDDCLENGCEMEVEIRGNSIWAVELIAERLKSLVAGTPSENKSMNCSLLDFYLWDYRRAHAKEMEHIPFHKTRCIYY